MKFDPQAEAATLRDLHLPGACIACGGDLAIRLSPAGARSWCGRCRWVSRLELQQQEEGLQIVHAAAAA